MRADLAYSIVLFSQPLRRADAAVVLSGDGEARFDMAIRVFAERGAPLLVLSGGVDNPPFSLTAHELARRAIDKGVDPERLVVEGASQNTREQAVNVVALAVDRGWKRLLLVASHYHMPRAFLTFVRALYDAGQQEQVHIVPLVADQVAWFDAPQGQEHSRFDLLDSEYDKIGAYSEHVATFDAGLAYLRFWEGK